MGGRGSSFKAKGIRIKNPAGIPSNAVTEDEFLAMRGVGNAVSGAGIDRYAGANMTRMTEKARKRNLAEIDSMNDDYYQRRQAAREEYHNLIMAGTIRDKTSLERTLTAAHGHPDNISTQAARRMAQKRGYDWKTGKKLKK